MREIAKKYPNIEIVDDITILALVEYGVGLAERPCHSPWEVAQPEDYLDVVVVRAKFLMAHPEHYKEWPKLVSLSERFVKRMETEGIPTGKTKWFQKRVKALWCRPSVMWMRFRNKLQPRQSVCDMKSICRKNKKKMKQTIRTFIAKIPLAKPLYCAVKNRCEGLRSRRAQDRLRKKQPILRQGSPECFESMPLRIDWFVTSHCNFRCSYCFRAGREYEKIFCTLEQVETAVKHLASANRPAYQVNLIGGEPTPHPHLAEIITLIGQYLGDRLEFLHISTNGSFTESQMEAILKAGEKIVVRLMISVHLEYMGVERVVELVKQYSSRTRLHIALMFHPELVEKAMAVADALCDLRKDYVIYMIVSELREPPDYNEIDRRYTQEHLNCKKRITDKFNKIREEGPKRHENPQQYFFVEQNVNDSIVIEPRVPMHKLEKMTGCSFTGLTCCAGTNYVRILVDGSVRGIDCDLDKPICNIFEENPFLREDWMHGVLCTMNRCGCNQNYRIPKFRSPADAQRLIAEKKLEQKKLMSAEEKI